MSLKKLHPDTPMFLLGPKDSDEHRIVFSDHRGRSVHIQIFKADADLRSRIFEELVDTCDWVTSFTTTPSGGIVVHFAGTRCSHTKLEIANELFELLKPIFYVAVQVTPIRRRRRNRSSVPVPTPA